MTPPPNPWKHVQLPDVTHNPYVNPPLPPGGSGRPAGSAVPGAAAAPAGAVPSVSTPSAYILMSRTATYAQGVENLQQACQQEGNTTHPRFALSTGSPVYRPLTFHENIEARVQEYNTGKNLDGSPRTEEERLHLFSRWLDSCTGIAYRKKSTQFKLIPECDPLIGIAADFKEAFMPISYRSIQGMELDSAARRVIYNNWLSQAQVVNHPAWKAAVGDDALLREYAGIVFSLLQSKYQRDTGMGFFVVQNPAEDQLRALFVDSMGDYSYAVGNNNLINVGSFLRVAGVVAHRRRAPAGRAP